ncbi:MAG: DUF1207 domain-containing protein [Melioribacteraceae bacterium]|nr:DUF1207 domain-containing protein [Melioribacteraceae bacterium]
MKKLVLLILLLSNVIVNAQDKFEIFPDDLLIQPFSANTIEPKMGFVFQTSGNELRLDIGNSLDLLRYNVSEKESISFGADLFTYTKLRKEGDFHFPVDAVDYLFGLNWGYVKKLDNSEFGVRLRFSHISAHLVDGRYDKKNMEWVEEHLPRVYSREFIEFFPYYKFNNLRVYAGYTYIYHIDPGYIGKNNYQAGFDYYLCGVINSFITPFAAYDIKIVDIDGKTANNSINIGVKFGKPFGKGFSVYYHYYSGKSVHGEFYEFKKDYSAIGVNFDL